MVGKILCFLIAVACAAQDRRMVTEKIEWTYSDQPGNPDPALPNVLLIGDSITRAYYPYVAKGLDGKANCYYFATSASIGDERLPQQIGQYFTMIRVPFAVIHFNNGMHGWGYSDAEYFRYFDELPATIRVAAPHAKLLWASTTPVRKDQPSGATKARIEARNAIAIRKIGPATPIDDQYLLMTAHGDLHTDDIHFNPEGSAIEAAQVLDSIVKLLAISPK